MTGVQISYEELTMLATMLGLPATWLGRKRNQVYGVHSRGLGCAA